MSGRSTRLGGFIAFAGASILGAVAHLTMAAAPGTEGPRASFSAVQETPEAALSRIESRLRMSRAFHIEPASSPVTSAALHADGTAYRVENGQLFAEELGGRQLLCRGIPDAGFRVVETEGAVLIRLASHERVATRTVPLVRGK